MRGKALQQFSTGRAERRALGVRNQIVYGEIIPTRLQPTQDGLDVIVSLVGLNRAKEGVFEEPIERGGWIRVQEIRQMKFRRSCGLGAFFAEADSAGGDIEARGPKTSLCPRPDVMTCSATWNADSASREVRVGRQEIDEAGRGGALFPRHILRLVTFFPIS